MAQTVLKKSKYWSLDSDIWVLKFNRYNFFYKSIHFKPSYQLGFWFPIFCLNASAKIWSSRGAFHHPPLMRNFPTSYLNPMYLAKVCYWFVPGDVGDMRRVRPHGKNFDLKFVIITILRRNNDDNDNNDDNKISGSNTNNNNNKNNNPFKVVCPQILVHNERTRAAFKHKTQQTFRMLIEEKRIIQVTKKSK